MNFLSSVLQGEQNYALLENIKSGDANLLFTEPCHYIIANKYSELPKALKEIEQYKKEGFFLSGYISYEVGYYFIDIFNNEDNNPSMPLLYFTAFKKLDRLTQKDISNFFNSISNKTLCIYDTNVSDSYKSYKKIIEKIKNYIEQGQTYQINYTFRYDFKLQGDILSFYSFLRKSQPVEYAALLKIPNLDILSFSPELFVKRNKQFIEAKPMKGTAGFSDEKQDKEVINFMRSDSKTLAENLMIVDLMRNDFGSICKTGTVKVDNLFQVQKFKTLYQMISTVKGVLPASINFTDILKKVFPSGSVTGTPKIRTMEIIKELEKTPRNIYTGAIGYLLPDNNFCFNVPIRTIVANKKKKCQMGIGSGVLYDSVAKDEYEESLLKANFLTKINSSFYLIESFRYDKQKNILRNLKKHLNRLRLSSKYFGFDFCKKKIFTSLKKHIRQIPTGIYKIRICLYYEGTVNVDSLQIVENTPDIKLLAVSKKTIDSGLIFQYHKTSYRGLYDIDYQKAVTSGHYDIVFLNEKNQISECARNNIFIRKNGHLLTPPLSSGILNGIYRQHMFNNHKVIEKNLYLEDLYECEQIILTNDVRGKTIVKLTKAII